MSVTLFERHRDVLDRAVTAIRDRGYWSAFSEIPSGKIYGETAAADGLASFQALLGKPFPLADQPATIDWGSSETNPYGTTLGITYPLSDISALISASRLAANGWRKTTVEERTGVCLEILHRLNARSFELAHAVMQTTGQGFVMAFQAGAPHAQDRGLEAVAYAYEEMMRVPQHAAWEKPQGKADPLKLDKTFRLVPRGIGLVIGCSTFPTWNSYGGLFASLATGNAVIVKPHPASVLPLAITVQVARDVLREAGYDPNTVLLAADTADQPITKELAMRPEIGIIDYTGSSAFGDWLEANARHAVVHTEKAGVNWIVIDSTDDLKGMARNIAFSLSLYSGQMCTTPQNIFIPADGITADGTHVAFDQVVGAVKTATDKLLGDPERAVEVLGAIKSEDTVARLESAQASGAVARPSAALGHPKFPDARVHTPLILKTDATDEAAYLTERFGPISLMIATNGTADSLTRAAGSARDHGAITASVYSTDPVVLEAAEAAAMDGGVALSCNLTGGVFVNQSAAYSDFHVSGANPAGNASLTDGAFVTGRFRVVQVRRPAAA